MKFKGTIIITDPCYICKENTKKKLENNQIEMNIIHME